MTPPGFGDCCLSFEKETGGNRGDCPLVEHSKNLTPETVRELARLAKDATPGRWYRPDGSYGVLIERGGAERSVVWDEEAAVEDMAYIAAASPDVISALAADWLRLWFAAAAVWDSVPASYDPNDARVRRHAQALNALHVALTGAASDEAQAEGGA